MKNKRAFGFKAVLSLIIAIVLIIGTIPLGVRSANAAAMNYNDGTRHKVCGDFSIAADNYYSGAYSFDTIKSQKGDSSNNSLTAMHSEIYDTLYTLMSDTQTYYPKYGGYTRNSLAYYWQFTDASEGKEGYWYFYSDVKNTEFNATMNREHVWAKSNASFYQKNGGSDLHHLRPTISYVNSSRNNYTFANVKGKISDYNTQKVDGKDVIWYSKSLNKVEVADDIKGDVARILLYVYVRWQQPNLFSFVNQSDLPPLDSDDTQNDGKPVIESLDTLLEWMHNDPVDTWEMSRNDLVQEVQGNRNVFIDYPEFAWMLFNKNIPNDMDTPSGYARTCENFDSDCEHEYFNVMQNPTCTEDGFIKYECKYCGYSYVEKFMAKGHNWECVDKENHIYRCKTCKEHRIIHLADSINKINDGDLVVIYCDEADKVMGCTPTGNGKLEDISPEFSNSKEMIINDRMAILTVVDNEDGTFSFVCNDRYLSCPPNGNGAFFTDENNDYCKWTLVNVHGGKYIKNVAAAYGEGENKYTQYLQCYDNFTVYGMQNDDKELFVMQFYLVSSKEHCKEGEHVFEYITNLDGTHTMVCTLCGYSQSAECEYKDNVCVYCGYENSNNNGPAQTTSDAEGLYGDVNCDKVVDMSDVTTLQKILAKLASYESYGKMSSINSDCSHDGVVTMLDVTFIQKYLAHLIDSLSA
ncbi:MAG: endonuclease [Clostridiales bacterium]|nr:endonuclease [Clostridiales bacterium]